MLAGTVTVGGVEIHAEQYRDPMELIAVTRSRDLQAPEYAGIDFLSDDPPLPRDPAWSGFSDPRLLPRMLLTGTMAKGLRDVALTDVGTSETERLSGTGRRPWGAAPIVPAVLAGDPVNMIAPVRRKVRSRILRLVVDTAVSQEEDPGAYRSAGAAVASAVASLERTGYRVEVTAMHAVWSCGGTGIGGVMALPVKRAGEPLNIPRLMFMTADPAFPRGVCFGWNARLPGFGFAEGLGRPLESAFPSRLRYEMMADVSAGIFGEDAVLMRVADIASRSKKHPDETCRYVTMSLMS